MISKSKVWNNKRVFCFIRFSHPTPEGLPIDWKMVDKEQEDVHYASITEDGLRTEVNPKAINYAFWDNFFNKYHHRLHVN